MERGLIVLAILNQEQADEASQKESDAPRQPADCCRSSRKIADMKECVGSGKIEEVECPGRNTSASLPHAGQIWCGGRI